jgi:hypothetical protein
LKNVVTILLLLSSWLTLFTATIVGCGNASLRKQKSQHEKIIYYQLGDTRVPIHVKTYGDRQDLVFVNLHDNEFTSVEGAMPVIEEKGGTFIRIENNRDRVISFRFRGNSYSFDPNRMFSDTGISETMKEQSRFNEAAAEEVKKFSERFLGLIPREAKYLIALHNNTDGGFSVLSYMQGGEYQHDAKKVYRNPSEDPDDLVYTTNEKVYKNSVKFGFNSVLQHKKPTPDGSLSVWAGENDWKYINLETEHGKVLKYREMLLLLVESFD